MIVIFVLVLLLSPGIFEPVFYFTAEELHISKRKENLNISGHFLRENEHRQF